MVISTSAFSCTRLLITGVYGLPRRINGGFKVENLVFGKTRYRTMVTRSVTEEASTSASKAINSNLSAYIKRQYDDVIASPEDKRHYRGLELVNNLKILLISDPTTDKSAASIDVNVGHLNDPKELPGLAHFCEHMLFLGTKKYPSENEYAKYLSSHGGCSNAYTASDHTNYHFDVTPEFLDGAVDRFAQFFIAPLFTESCTEREVMAVDSEHSNNVQNDSWRFCQLERTLSKPTHAYCKFGTGNRKTLLDDARLKKMDPRQELLKFHGENYSSNLMALAVLGKESLDELAQMVVPIFAQIPNKNLPAPEWLEHPYGPEQLGYKIKIVPIKDLRSLHVFFPIPDLHPYYKSNPGHYVSHLLGHEGAGSLLSELKRLGWVNGLSAGPQTTARGFGFFQVDFELSEAGLDHTEDIVRMMFGYINMLKSTGAQEWVHREVESLNNINFRFQDKIRPQSYVTHLATCLHDYPVKEVLYAPYMMPDYKPELIVKLLDMLNPNNFGYTVMSQKFKGKTDQTEKWYGTEFSMEKIDSKLLRNLAEKFDSSSSTFKIPARNEFIPDDFKIYAQTTTTNAKDIDKAPIILHNDPHTRLWFKPDEEFLLPKCCVFLHFRNPVVYQDPFNNTLATLFSDLLRDSLTEYSYDASLAGLRYSLSNGRYGFSLTVDGYNQKQKVLLEKLVEKFVQFKPDAERFKILKERFVRNLKNFAMDQPYHHAMYYTNVLLTDKVWTKDEILKEAENLTLDQLIAFKPRFLEAMHIEGYVHGNAMEKEAVEILNTVRGTIQKSVPFKPLYSSQLAKDRSVCLSEKSSYYFEAENKTHANSAMEVILQTGVENPRINMLNELIGQIFHEPCFNQLRTKEQLGYIVFSGLRRSNGSQGLRFIVQGEKSPDVMDTRLEAFLEQMEKTMIEMPEKEFEEHKTALTNIRLERPKKLSSMATKYWNEITAEQYHFNRDIAEVDVLKKLTKEDVLKFFKESVRLDAPKRKKLSVYVHSSAKKEKSNEKAKPPVKSEEIKNVSAFKARLPLYELPKPYRDDIPAAGLGEFQSKL